MQTLCDCMVGIDILKHLKREHVKNGLSKSRQQRFEAKDLVV